MKPLTLSEQALYNTVRIVSSDGGTGTGFFFEFMSEKGPLPVIITNKHVVNNNNKEIVKFNLHTGLESPNNESIEITLQNVWLFHPTQDLCFCFVGKLFHDVKTRTGKDVFYIPLREDLILNDLQLENELSALEDCVMVGYPNGLWDEKNNFPLLRKGVTSSHPAIDFQEKSQGVVDMACFPGSSGSPIFILNENHYTNKTGNSVFGQSRIIFLGVLHSGPITTAEGEIIIQDIPTQQKAISSTPLMINLGYYVKAKEIIGELKRQAIEIFNRDYQG